MLKLAADENFNGRILRGLLRRDPDIDIIRIQDTEAYQADDPEMLEWAANQGRIVLTHDVRTVTKFANERIREGKPMPGIFEVSQSAPIGRVIEDFLLLAVASSQDELGRSNTLYSAINGITMPDLSISFLGSFAASLDGQSLLPFRAKSVQALLIYLVYLVYEAEQVHRREALIDLLWSGLTLASVQMNM